jgi:hypothetical protein
MIPLVLALRLTFSSVSFSCATETTADSQLVNLNDSLRTQTAIIRWLSRFFTH